MKPQSAPTAQPPAAVAPATPGGGAVFELWRRDASGAIHRIDVPRLPPELQAAAANPTPAATAK
jgi:hypothetical protein